MANQQFTFTCSVCDNPCSHLHSKIRLGYKLMQCNRCGLISVYPIPNDEELKKFYNNIYEVPLTIYSKGLLISEQRLNLLERYIQPPGRLLEIGCSYGYGLDLARQRGWEVEGIEFSSKAMEYARNKFGLSVYSSFGDPNIKNRLKYDAIVAWHVFEHTQSPLQWLKTTRELLHPETGILGLIVPNISSISARILGQKWQWLSPPEHLYYFKPCTITYTLRCAGFEVCYISTQRGALPSIYLQVISAFLHTLNDIRLWFRWQNGRLLKKQNAFSANQDRLNSFPEETNFSIRYSANTDKHLIPFILNKVRGFTTLLDKLSDPAFQWFDKKGWGDEIIVIARPAT